MQGLVLTKERVCRNIKHWIKSVLMKVFLIFMLYLMKSMVRGAKVYHHDWILYTGSNERMGMQKHLTSNNMSCH